MTRTTTTHSLMGAAVLALLLSACSTLSPGAEEVAPEPVPLTEQRAVDLRYVTSSAAACDQVWNVGALLPADYEWCQDSEGEPVAGVRIGSCEVVVHGNELYASPGRRIRAVIGTTTQDREYVQSLTACKRRPFERENR